MVSPPRPGVKYTAAQVEAMRQAYPDFIMPGYVMRIDADGLTSFIPWNEASGGGHREDGSTGLRGVASDKVYVSDGDPFGPPPAIQKRTAQQRMESLVSSLIEDWKKYGGIPALQSGVAPRVYLGNGQSRPPTTAEREEYARRRAREIEDNERTMQALVRESWRAGQPISADDVYRAAATLLGQAEDKFEASERKKVVRTSPTD